MPQPTPFLLEICERGVTLRTGPAWALTDRVIVTAFAVVADPDDPDQWQLPRASGETVTYRVRAHGFTDTTVAPLQRDDHRLALLEVLGPPTVRPFTPASCADASSKADADREWIAVRRDGDGAIHRIGGIVHTAGETLLLRLYGTDSTDPDDWAGTPVVQGNHVVGVLTGAMVRPRTLSAVSADAAFESLPDAKIADAVGELHSGFVLAGLRELARSLARPRQWARDVRLANWRLTPTFAVSTLDTKMVSDARVASLLARCLLGPAFLIAGLALIVWYSRGILHLSPDWQNELGNHLALATSAALLAGLCFAVTSNVAAGMAATTLGGVVGILSAIVATTIFPTARGYLTGGLTCGVALGASVAILRRDAPREAPESWQLSVRRGIGAIVDTTVLLLIIGAIGWLLSIAIGSLLSNKELSAKTSGAVLGIVAGIPVILAGWLRRRASEHGRDTTKARTLVRTIALAVSTLGGLAAITVGPNGDPHTPLYSGAVGILAGGLTGGIFGLLLVTSEGALGVARGAIACAVAGIGVLALLFAIGVFSHVSHEYMQIVLCTAVAVPLGSVVVALLNRLESKA
jgi:hypothetical protein